MGGKKHLKPHREEHERLRIVYYVTGRGFGHATRAIEICRHLIEEGHDVCICSTVPEYFFKNELPDILYRECEVDTAVIQHDAMTVSRKESLELYYSHIHEKRDEILQREKEFLEVARPDCVAVDAAPVALAAAAAAGRPAALVSNFRWDYIYRGILASLTEKELPPDLAARYEAMLGQMNLDYRGADEWLRLPGHHPAPREKGDPSVVGVPLVVRRPHRSRAQARRELAAQFPADYARLAVLSLGDHARPDGREWDFRDEYLPPGWRCLVLGIDIRKRPATRLGSRFHLVDRDAYVPDLLMAADVVFGKLGYSTMAELLATGRPCVYVSRKHWSEEPFLVDMLSQHGVLLRMPRRDLDSGAWAEHLEEAVEAQAVTGPGQCKYRECMDGGKVVAEILIEMAERRKKEMLSKTAGGSS
eukprot:CAMPEP_0194581420 /NCGR_PEP_ID=MMETSP0292-20121207/14883_1 /TAXON_ID=39354 /ORGANISM="Heterosigma akashiwo, Strain CCMP2393" /LENGTH=417 /DNA_ID=CAMNT_0039435147 /DNA_START=190 /DNA_END=1443 /DNA_ORIENTATION=-